MTELESPSEPEPNSQVSLKFARQQHAGILPPAEELERLEKVHAGITEWLLKRLDSESSHRRKIEIGLQKEWRDDCVAARSAKRRGQFIGLGVIVLCEILATIIALNGGSPWVAATIAGTPIAGASYIWATQTRHSADPEPPNDEYRLVTLEDLPEETRDQLLAEAEVYQADPDSR